MVFSVIINDTLMISLMEPAAILQPSQNMTTVKAKIKTIILGDQSTGKTSLITRFISNKFNEGAQPTIGIDFLSRNITVDNSEFRIQLWDTAGQERFRSLIPSYLKDASIVLIVFDVTNRKSFEGVDAWFDLYGQYRPEKSYVLLVGNKVDLEREISTEEGSRKAVEHSTLYFETSARTSTNVESVFVNAVKHFRDNLLAGTANTIVTQFDLSNSAVVSPDAQENKTSIADGDRFRIGEREEAVAVPASRKKCC